MSAVEPGSRRVRARVQGTVQGVGFRPYVHRLAGELGLAGWVLNDERGVQLEVEGPAARVQAFLERLAPEAPPAATVRAALVEDLAPHGGSGFHIAQSTRSGPPGALHSPDIATCDRCLQEMLDPADRRHRYPFINCASCGPRFTIVQGLPYDRPRTTMRAFAMCEPCQMEYDDPADRRFHAEANACPQCGPRLRLVEAAGRRPPAQEPLAAVAAALARGAIVAIKGLGGIHLACLAEDKGAVATLRARKRRDAKPFALMVADIATAERVVQLAPAARALLTGRERPVVLAPRQPGSQLPEGIAPGSPDIGVMLPYTPLHHLLTADVGAPLVMTSGNVSDEPIVYRDEQALERLAGIADLFLLHDRPIHTRVDDSVVRTTAAAGPIPIRRARGYVPRPLELPDAAVPLLAAGAELKSTFCVARGTTAWVSHHIGDLRGWETLRSYREAVRHYTGLLALEPEVVAHDLHPDYLSTRYALEYETARRVAVQHHHAHLAACLAEHGERGPAVGAIYDGAGLGSDGTVWGGELLAGGLDDFRRVGHLWPVSLPGGDAAARQPWRMACAWLCETLGDPEPERLADVAGERWRAVGRLAASGTAPLTSSAGRLFDAVAALIGARTEADHEGQAALELERLADPDERGCYPLPVLDMPAGILLDARETILAVLADRRRHVDPALIAARFHRGLASGTAHACALAAERCGTELVVLSGGVFQNRLLLQDTTAALARRGLRVLRPERLPPNDGGIAYGQAAVTAAGCV